MYKSNVILAAAIGGLSSYFSFWLVAGISYILKFKFGLPLKGDEEWLPLLFIIYQIIELLVCVVVLKIVHNNPTEKLIILSFVIMFVIAVVMAITKIPSDAHFIVFISTQVLVWAISYPFWLYVSHKILNKYFS